MSCAYDIRGAVLADEDQLLDVAHHLNTVNLPADREGIRTILELAHKSFSGAIKDPKRREYVFVLVDLERGRIVGTSMVIGQLGRRDAPYIYVDVSEEERYSATLDRHFNHVVLKIGYAFAGPTEIGGLIVLPEYRKKPERVGLLISYVRLLYVSMHREWFKDELLAELLPPLEPDGTSHLWNALGRKFTDLTYAEADRLSKQNKEFIKGLFPEGAIYASLLPEDAQAVIGKVGAQIQGGRADASPHRLPLRIARRSIRWWPPLHCGDRQRDPRPALAQGARDEEPLRRRDEVARAGRGRAWREPVLQGRRHAMARRTGPLGRLGGRQAPWSGDRRRRGRDARRSPGRRGVDPPARVTSVRALAMCQTRRTMTGAASRRGKRSPARGEEIEVRTPDGWSLRTDVHEAVGASALVGVAVLAHAFMARRTEFYRFERGGLAGLLAGLGWRVIVFDFRTHGDSGPGAHEAGTYGYDDLVTLDMPAMCAFARSRAGPRLPVVVVGHSLGGHVALAAQATGAIDVDAVVGVAASPWLRDLEPSRGRWMVKRAVLAAALGVSRRVGRFPSRALGRGSDDEPRACIEDFGRFARTGAWTSVDGRTDYLASLERIRVPVLSLVSEGDQLECAPPCGERLLTRAGGPTRLVRVEHRDDGSPPPGHMGLVTSGQVRNAWRDVESWMRAVG